MAVEYCGEKEALPLFGFMRNLVSCVGGAFALLVGFGGLLRGHIAAGGGILVLGLALAGFGIYGFTHRKKETIPSLDLGKELSKEQAELAQAIFEKAREDYRRIEAVRKELQDTELCVQLDKMQDIALRMFAYLSAHPKFIPQARRFAETYQDRAASLVEEYRELETTGVTGGKVAETRKRIKAALFSFDEAYEAEFSRLLHTKLLDVDAEIDVLKETMKADGALDTEDFAVVTQEEPAEEDSKESPAGPPVNRGGRKIRPKESRATIFEQGIGLPEEMRSRIIKDKVICGLLAIFLGTFGAHRFYRGQTALGLVYAGFFWSSIPTFVGIIEGIRYLVMPVTDYYRGYMRG